MGLRLGYLASGAGSSAKAIHAAEHARQIDVTSALVISNNSGSDVLRWAGDSHIPWSHLSGRTHPDPGKLDVAMRDALLAHGAELVILAGYAKLVGPATLGAFPNRILNVHPAPLPQFGGQGMYSLAVHQAVLDADVSESAVTIHIIDERNDHGPTVYSFPVSVRRDDTAESLQARVGSLEGDCYVEVLRRLTAGEVDLDAIARQA